MKQSKTEKAVFAKLASQRVELSALDSLNAATKQMQGFNDEYESLLKGNFKSALQSIRAVAGDVNRAMIEKDQVLKGLQKSYNEVKAAMKAMSAAAKELGTNAKDIKEYRAADQFLGLVETRISFLKQEFDAEIKAELQKLL